MKFQLPDGDYLITGGAGYLGGLCAKRLLEVLNDSRIIIIDNLSKGRLKTIKKLLSLKSSSSLKFIRADVGQPEDYQFIFKTHQIRAVFHFAGLIEVGESIKKPKKYFLNNAVKPEKLLQTMIKHHCRNIIFSSTASVYGLPRYLPIDETHPTKPFNPYGISKLAFEKILLKFQKEFKLNFIAFRYFNAAGAAEDGTLGENHSPETHLIPNILLNLKSDQPVKVFGHNYPTPDGTCIRDYIHVADLIEAHLLGIQQLLQKKTSRENFINLDSGHGCSILEVIKTAEKVTGRPVPFKFEKRRRGDVPVLVASNQLAQKILGWGQKLKNLEEIIASTWQWHSQ